MMRENCLAFLFPVSLCQLDILRNFHSNYLLATKHLLKNETIKIVALERSVASYRGLREIPLLSKEIALESDVTLST